MPQDRGLQVLIVILILALDHVAMYSGGGGGVGIVYYR